MKYHTSQIGFSLVETLVAITILLLVIIGPLTISSSSVRSSAFASEQVTAFFLAQEGAELAQMARDQFVLENFKNPVTRPNPWSDFSNQNGVFQNCYTATGCSTNINTDSSGTLSSIRNCSDIANCKLYLNTSQSVVRSRYNHDNSGGTTPFTRVIRFTRVGLNEVSVISTVTWQSGFSREGQQVSVQTSLLNIYGTN